MASTEIILKKEETNCCDISTTTNDFNSHPRTRFTRIQVDSDSTRNLSISLQSMASTKIVLQKEETKRCDLSTTTNDFNSHPSTRRTRIQLDSDLTTNLSISLYIIAITKLMLQKEETKRCDLSTTTNDLNSHPSTRCTRIQVDSYSNRNLSISL